MTDDYNRVIRTYFSNYITKLLVVSCLFIALVGTSIAINGMNSRIYLYCAAFGVIFLLSAPLLILYVKVKKDIKSGKTKTLTVKISEIQYDNRHAFSNRAGKTVGKDRYRIVDENQNVFLLSAAGNNAWGIRLDPPPAFHLEITFLEKSRLVLHMKIIEDFKSVKQAHKQRKNMTQLKSAFSHYF